MEAAYLAGPSAAAWRARWRRRLRRCVGARRRLQDWKAKKLVVMDPFGPEEGTKFNNHSMNRHKGRYQRLRSALSSYKNAEVRRPFARRRSGHPTRPAHTPCAPCAPFPCPLLRRRRRRRRRASMQPRRGVAPRRPICTRVAAQGA